MIFPRTPPMTALGPARGFKEPPKWRHGRSHFEVLTDYFLPALEDLEIPYGNAAVLASTWFPYFHLAGNSVSTGLVSSVPALDLTARSQFAPLAEQVCGYMMESNPDAIVGIERTLFSSLLDMTGRANFDVFSYRGRAWYFACWKVAKRCIRYTWERSPGWKPQPMLSLVC